jgi:predicted ArsR family transcriptional regulator
LLLALCSQPLDVDQLAAELGLIPVAVTSEVHELIEAGLVHAVTMETERLAWGLTVRGRSRVARASP